MYYNELVNEVILKFNVKSAESISNFCNNIINLVNKGLFFIVILDIINILRIFKDSTFSQVFIMKSTHIMLFYIIKNIADPKILNLACSALSLLTSDPCQFNTLVKGGLFPLLLTLLHSSDNNVLGSAVNMLGYIFFLIFFLYYFYYY